MPKKASKRNKLDARRVATGALAVLLALALLLPLLASAILNARAVTSAELKVQISGLKKDAEASKARKKELQAELERIKGDEAQALQRKKIVDQQLAAIDADISNTQQQIDGYNTLIAAEEEALAAAQERESAAYARFCQRARAMEEAGDVSYLSVLFSANSFTDLLDRLALVDEIMAYDNSVVDALTAARIEVEEHLAALNEAKEGLEEQKAVLDAQRAEQAAKAAEAQALLEQLKKQADAQEALVEAEEAEEARIARELSKKEKQYDDLIKSQKITFTTGSGYQYPLPSSNVTITSKFGPRNHPLTGKPHNHTGIDISAPGGTTISAVQGGVVVTSAYAPSSYGEYVVVNHGNGITTLYAHMQRGSRKVKEGDVVRQGQALGLVGSTGSATGNHLHLELRKNGVRQDPSSMFPGVSFTYL